MNSCIKFLHKNKFKYKAIIALIHFSLKMKIFLCFFFFFLFNPQKRLLYVFYQTKK